MPPTLNTRKSIVLFRQDLRLSDNPALFHAAKKGAVIPVFIYDDSLQTSESWFYGSASKWWLHHSLCSLKAQFSQHGLELLVFKGKALDILTELSKLAQARHIYWNRRYAPEYIKHDSILKSRLISCGLKVTSFNSHLLNEPWEIINQQGNTYKVFTPYWRQCIYKLSQEKPVPLPLVIPPLKACKIKTKSIDIHNLELLPSKPNWAKQFDKQWSPGEAHAQSKWNNFIQDSIYNYEEHRNIPSIKGTSLLSPHLAFGEISPRQIWHDIQVELLNGSNKDLECYLSEIGWREFSYSLLYNFPHIDKENFKEQFNKFTWNSDKNLLTAWQQGNTGYPLVDAGMRELWQTGYMHNRVRMIVASFLCKDLLLPWQLGAQWFWDTLLDADLASNSASWQWCAGSGADASPFFRIFNPITQSEKFDKEGAYIKKWVPELSNLPEKFIHKPWDAPSDILLLAKVRLGDTYPHRIVNHKLAREDALLRYSKIKDT